MWYPTDLTPTQREAQRMTAGRLSRAGRLSHAEIARQLDVTPAAVNHWAVRLRQYGRPGLRRRPHVGRPPPMDPMDWERLGTILRRGARASGFDTDWPAVKWGLAAAGQSLPFWTKQVTRFGSA